MMGSIHKPHWICRASASMQKKAGDALRSKKGFLLLLFPPWKKWDILYTWSLATTGPSSAGDR